MSATESHLTVTISPTMSARLKTRAERAGLFDADGRPDISALLHLALRTVRAIGEPDPVHAIATDLADPDLATYARAAADAAAARNPPRWGPNLNDRLHLEPAIQAHLHRRAEKERLPSLGVPDFATMASCELVYALEAAPPTDGKVAAFIAEHPDSAMRTLCRELERARAASRPN